ncbi:MAG: hypothetical protein BAJALOKI2v1_240055 [Promethearchaeota archaeon]|nr:MAG: hypothetical protein BAJALOKI2v1_240055 [Candidatus Lokiarchaeota archaeon]
MKYLILSHYYSLRPKIFLKAPESNKDGLFQVPTLMELYERGFFIHMFAGFKTANLKFSVPSKYGRGKNERLMISIVIESEDKINTSLSEQLLETFVSELKKVDNVYKAFYLDSKMYQGDQDKFNQVKELFNTFFETLPKQDIIFERKEAKVLIFGLSLAGKTSIIRCRRKSLTKNVLPTLNVDISRILVNNISLITYDVPGQPKFKDLWRMYLKEQNGLIFVVDVSDKVKFPDAKHLLHLILSRSETKNLPLLILFNKIDLEKANMQELKEKMEVSNINDRPVKCFLTSATKNTNVDKAFNWLALKVSEQAFPTPKSDLGVLFSTWDENLGVKVVGNYPKEAFDDPELIAIRCFSVSQFIFGGEKFKKVSVVLPLPHLKAKASIFFDFVESEEVRGGNLPLSIVLYFKEKIPRAVIEQFNDYILDQFEILKKQFRNKEQVKQILQEIHSTVSTKLEEIKSTVEALRIAEIRYQSLFKAARDAILIIDQKSGIILDANNQAEKLLQRPIENIIGTPSSRIKISKKDANFLDLVLNQLSSENSRLLVVNIENPLERDIPVEINASEIQVGGQNVIQCILRDITKREKAEKKLKDSENKFRHLFENSPFGILLINQKGKIVNCNPAFEKLLDYHKDELLGKKFMNLSIVHQNYLVILMKRLRDLPEINDNPPLDVRLYKKDNSLIWSKVHTSHVKIGDDYFFQILAYDITDQKEAEREIKNKMKSERIMSIISSRFVGKFDFDTAILNSLRDMGRLIDAQRSFLIFFAQYRNYSKSLYEWCREDVCSREEDLKQFDPKNFPWLLKNLEKDDFIFVENFEKLPEEAINIKFLMKEEDIETALFYALKLQDKTIGILGFDDPKKADNWDEENLVLFGIIAEIFGNSIERRRTEIELRESKDRYHNEIDRIHFYNELFNQDINYIFENLFKAINGLQLSREIKDDQQFKHFIKTLEKEFIEGSELVRISKKLADLEHANIMIHEMDIINLVEESIKKVENLGINKEIEIEIEYPDGKLLVYGDEILRLVIENILISSIKYNEKKEINIKIIIFQNQREKQNYLKIEFIDHQELLSDHKKEDFLDKKGKNDKEIRGALLRFLLIERILDLLNGDIWVEGGAKFVILLPEA